jgi:hypothetical protein
VVRIGVSPAITPSAAFVGCQGNEELLMSYGFCLAANPHDKVTLKLNFNRAPFAHARTTVLERLGVMPAVRSLRGSV